MHQRTSASVSRRFPKPITSLNDLAVPSPKKIRQGTLVHFRLPRLAQSVGSGLGIQLARGDSEMMRIANRIGRKWHCQNKMPRKRNVREKMLRQTASNRKSCQDSEMSSANQIKRKWHHQKKASREKTFLQAPPFLYSHAPLETSVAKLAAQQQISLDNSSSRNSF